VSGKTRKVLRTVKVGADPDAVAIDPKTNIAYVSSFDSNEINVIPAN
jgi:DNA-binding beta-propeller fold protein YncE